MFSSSFWKGRVHVRLCVLCCLRRFCCVSVCVCVCYLVSECFTELRFHALFQALPEWGGYFGSEWHLFRVILHVSLHTFLHFFLPLCFHSSVCKDALHSYAQFTYCHGLMCVTIVTICTLFSMKAWLSRYMCSHMWYLPDTHGKASVNSIHAKNNNNNNVM